MRGLVNLGNTCYFNSAVQVLSHVPALTNKLLRVPYVGECNVTREYQKVVKLLWRKDLSCAVNPAALLGAFRTRFPAFANCGQHDAQEVIICLIDIFESSLGLEFVRSIFNGQETQETVFPDGKSVQQNTFTTIMFTPSASTNLVTLLEAKQDKWDTVEGYTDDDGKTHHIAAVRRAVTQWPTILMLSFGMYIGPKVDIQLPPTLAGGYRLFAVVMHAGVAHGGHYSVVVRRHEDWFLKDDDCVGKTQPPLNGQCYMALYR